LSKTAGREFMEQTEYPNLGPSDQSKGLPQPPLEKGPRPGQTLLDLPAAGNWKVSNLSLTGAIERRRSVRKYSEASLTLEELSYLLFCTQGVQEVLPRPATMRPTPSAGARHAFETYILCNRVQGLEPGLYRFVAIPHKLVAEDLDESITERIAAACFNQYVSQSAATFIWTADVYRMAWRYGERSYRYLHLDAGHVCQNLYLAAEAVGAGCCAIGAFLDDEFNIVLGLDGENDFVVYAATVGKKSETG
jgi:SagB-type dehydrogenase family enzyme